MAATLNGKVNITVVMDYLNTIGLATTNGHIEKNSLNAITSGVGASQSDKIFSEMAKSISGNYDVDLAGVLLDQFGAAISFARIKLIAIFVDPASVSNVVVGNAAANQFVGPFGAAAHTTNVRPGGSLVMLAPDNVAWPVTAATADILRLAPSGASALFDWVVMGASA